MTLHFIVFSILRIFLKFFMLLPSSPRRSSLLYCPQSLLTVFILSVNISVQGPKNDSEYQHESGASSWVQERGDGAKRHSIPRARTTRYFQDHSLAWSQATGTPTFSPFFKRKGSTRCYGLHISQELKTHFTPIKSSVLGLEMPQQLGVLCVLQETFPQPPCRASTAPLRSARKGSLTLCTKTSVLKVGPESTLKEIKCLVLKKKKKQKTCIWFPTHTSGSSQPPTIPAPEDPIPSPGIHEYFFHVEYTQKKY